MSEITMTAEATSVEFGAECFCGNAKVYAENKRIVDAASKYDSLDDAIAALTEVWNALEIQTVDGGGYTPSTELGFGSDNASQIASAILGRKTSVTATRKAFAALGK
jgi:hypothetical protein